MPKPFSPKEREKIRERLMDEGLKRFARQGVRAMRIDDLCRDVGIAKGSFYAFFPSKEDLFMAIGDERDIQHKNDMRAYVLAHDGTPAALLNGFFDFMMERIDTDPVLAIVRDSGEIAYLMRRVSPERIAENARRDREFMAEISGILRARCGLTHADQETLEGLLTIMLSVGLQAEHFDSIGYDSVTKLLRDLFVARLLKGPLND